MEEEEEEEEGSRVGISNTEQITIDVATSPLGVQIDSLQLSKQPLCRWFHNCLSVDWVMGSSGPCNRSVSPNSSEGT